MLRQWRNVRRWLPGVLISVVAIVLVFRLASFKDLTEALGSARPLNLTLSFLILITATFSRAMAWRVLLGGKPKIWRTYLIVNEGYLLNYLFPLRAGELGRAVFMGREMNISPFQVLSTIVIERAFDVAMAAALVLTTLPLALGLDWAGPVAAGSLAVVLMGLVFLFLLARYQDRVHGWIDRLPVRFEQIKRLILPRLDSLLAGLSALRSPQRFLIALMWIALAWGQWLVMHTILFQPIAPHSPFWWMMFMDGITALGMAVPSAPGGLGIFEAAVVGALSILGISASAALAFALLMRLLQIVNIAIFGLIGLLQDGKMLSEINLAREAGTLTQKGE
jgi:glycosyltransferase 2 family protein